MQQGGYDFASIPRSVGAKRNKLNKEPKAERPQNIMYDRRIYRGSAFVIREDTPDTAGPNGTLNEPPKHSQPRRSKVTNQQDQTARPNTPPPVEGRYHMDIQTDNYLEELTDRAPEVDTSTQTDALLDLHPPVDFVPRTSGKDVATQIENGDLFDFDVEVAPILEVLVGKSLELSVLEVMEEDELSEIRKRQELFEQARNAEMAEVQRLEAEAKRRYAEKQRRIEEEAKQQSVQAKLEEKVAARACAKRYLGDLHRQVFDSLVSAGTFEDPLTAEIRESVIPKLVEDAARSVSDMELARNILDNIIKVAVVKQAT